MLEFFALLLANVPKPPVLLTSRHARAPPCHRQPLAQSLARLPLTLLPGGARHAATDRASHQFPGEDSQGWERVHASSLLQSQNLFDTMWFIILKFVDTDDSIS